MIISITSPRSGSHMLHSMLATDPGLLDVGCLAMGETTYDYRGDKSGLEAYADIQSQHPDCIILGNMKMLMEAPSTDAVFIHLYRRHLLDLYASTLIAQVYRCWYAPPAEPVGVTLDRASVDLWRSQVRKAFVGTRALLDGHRTVEIAYEDLNCATLDAALRAIGVELVVTNPTTKKISPPFADCVTNWGDFDPAHYQMEG